MAISGDIIYSGGATDPQVVVQTANGPERALKTMDVLGGGGGGGYVLPTATASRLGGIKVGENLTVEADGTLNAQAGGGGTATVSWFDNQSGFSVNTGLEIPSSARVQVYKNGKLLQAGTPLTFRHYQGGNGHSVYLTSVAPISTANSWRLEFREHWTPGVANLPSLLAGAGTTDCQAPSICVDSNKIGYFLSDNGSLWSIAYGSQSSLTTPTNGTKFDIAMEFTGTNYYLYYKLADSDIWTTVQTTTSSLKAYCADAFRFLLNKIENGNNYNNASTLYWETVKIIIDGQTWFDGATAVEGTDFVNDGCTLTEIDGSTNDYTIDTTTGVISFGQELFNDDIAVEVITSESVGNTVDYSSQVTNKPSINSVTLTGNKTASDLHLQGATSIVTLTTASTELATNTIYNGGELASVTLTLPATVPADFIAQVEFTSGATATTFTAPATVIFEGNDCSNGVFTPLASKRYSVMVYSDGVNVIGLVMGN